MPTREEEAAETANVFLHGFIADGEDAYFGSALFSRAKILSVSLPPAQSSPSDPTVPVRVTVRCTIPASFNNRVNNLHGGAASTIFDNLNSTALAVWANHCAPNEDMASRWFRTGVSRTLNTSYLRPVQVGDEVDVLNEVVSVGKNLALVRSSMTKVSDGKVVCTCEHHKSSVLGGEKL